MTDRIAMPGDLDRATRFAGRFTIRDIGRIAIPGVSFGIGGWTAGSATGGSLIGVSAGLIGGLVGGLAGLGLGAGLYAISKDGKKLDEYLHHRVRWKALHSTVEESSVQSVRDDHIVTADGAHVAVHHVKPVPTDLLTVSEIAQLHDRYADLLSAPPEGVRFQVHSRHRVLDLADAADRLVEAEAGPDKYREAYVERLRSYSENEITVTDHFIVLRVAGDRDDSPVLLDKWSEAVRKSASGAAFDVERVTGCALDEFVSRFYHEQPEPSAEYLRTNGEYQRGVYLTGFPEEVSFGWPVGLLEKEASIDIVQTIERQPRGAIVDHLDQVERTGNFEVTHWLKHGLPGAEEIERLIDDARSIRERLKLTDANAYRVGYLLLARGPTPTACDDAFEQLIKWIDGRGFEHQEPVYRTDEAYATVSPFQQDRLDESLLMPDTSAAASFPFGTQYVESVDGPLYGTAEGSGTPVFLDRFRFDSPHAVRIGRTGAGKTVATLLEILRTALVYRDLQIVIVSPKADDVAYAQLTRALGGTVVRVAPGGRPEIPEDDIVCFQFGLMSNDKRVEALRYLVDRLQVALQNERRSLVVLDEGHHLLRDREGCATLSAWVRESRSSRTAVTVLTQSVADFAVHGDGDELLDNVSSVWFMRHEVHQKRGDKVQELFGLSAQVFHDLSELDTGGEFGSEAIIRSPEQPETRVRIRPTDAELEFIEALEKVNATVDPDVVAGGEESSRRSGDQLASNKSVRELADSENTAESGLEQDDQSMEFSTLHREVRELERERAGLQRDIDELETGSRESGSVEGELENLEAQRDSLKQQVDNLQQDVDEIEDTQTKLQDECAALEEEVKALERSRETLRKEVRDIEEEHATYHRELNELADQRSVHKEEVDDLEQSVSNLKKRRDDLQQEVEELEGKREVLREEFEELKDRSRVLEQGSQSPGEPDTSMEAGQEVPRPEVQVLDRQPARDRREDGNLEGEERALREMVDNFRQTADDWEKRRSELSKKVQKLEQASAKLAAMTSEDAPARGEEEIDLNGVVDRPVESLLPELLPGWQKAAFNHRRKSLFNEPLAKDWTVEKYASPNEIKYLLYICRWKPEYIKHGLNLYDEGFPIDFIGWVVRDEYTFAVAAENDEWSIAHLDEVQELLAEVPCLTLNYVWHYLELSEQYQ